MTNRAPTDDDLAKIIWEEDGPDYRGWPCIGRRVDWCYSNQYPEHRQRCFRLARAVKTALIVHGELATNAKEG